MPAARSRYPGARLLGPKGLERKQHGLDFEPLRPEDSPALRDVFAAREIEGAPKISETVLFHLPSRSLIVTDLVFNIDVSPSWTTSLLLGMMGARGRLSQSRAWGFLLEEESRARASCERLFDWDFDRLLVAHGTVVPTNGKALLAAALTRTGPKESREVPASAE